MKLLFNIEYQTTFGEDLVLNIKQNNDRVSQHRMSTLDGYHWYVEIADTWKVGTAIDYYYCLMRGKELLRQEWLIETHRIELVGKKINHYTVYDHWIDIPEDAYLYSSAFTECVMPSECKPCSQSSYVRTLIIKVRAPQLRIGERLAMVGEPAVLGAWDTQKAVPMTEHAPHEWVACLDATNLPIGYFEFKFIVLGTESENTVLWEQGENRCIDVPNMGDKEALVYELSQANFSIYPWKGAGTVIPIFSLRSEGSFGVGDFGDLKMMVDWAARTEQRFIQVLPINDTNMTGTWQDSYPYNCISIYALHPQYTDFRQLPEIKDKEAKTQFEALRQELNSLPQIDYERMFKAKLDYLHVLFEQEWKRVKATKSYKEFYNNNKEWLEPYAQFCVNRDKEGQVEFWYYVQYNLDQQMRAAHEYARKHRVVLKGDIPIGISRDGVEAWVEPKYFNLNGQAGAPPDPFSADGQNWGFPTYNWDEMLKDGCQWWVRRFRKMAEYFDAYRIDHVLGFFRIWEIPMPEKSGLMGQFAPALGLSREEIEGYGIYGHDDLFLVDHKRSDRWHPRIAVQYQEAYERLNDGEKYNFNRLYNDYFYRRNNQFWYQEAMKKLPRLTQATRMLCCAEDLGMVPDCVPWVMNELRILTLEIQTMPKDPNIRFGKLSHNPYRSVCTFSTHDMPTLRQWWDEDWEQTQAYYNGPLRRSDAAPHPLPGWLAKDIVSRQLTSPSMLCLLSLQDWLSIDEKLRLPDQNAERINIPAIPRYYWRYRMHLTLEQLLKEDEFNENIKTLITQSGRK
ncbi:4-alpha-glucanotransferase [Prevotellaceae bacterium MN60]|nr:4-alpha-glucanotransferase [Prevotellaceae bacterium MN60]